jgi:hypothetical protein
VAWSRRQEILQAVGLRNAVDSGDEGETG